MQPAPLTGTATEKLFLKLGEVTGCSPRPSRGQQLLYFIFYSFSPFFDAARAPHGDSNS